MLRDPQQGSQQAFQQTLQSQAARGCIQGRSAEGCVISITEEAGRKRMVGSKPKWLTKKKIPVKKVLSNQSTESTKMFFKVTARRPAL